MKYRILVILISLSFLCATASAQTYSVRVTFNTNLRAGYSLQARIIDTAPAGATLSVAGNHEKWLLIDWNGRQVWMADWVPLTRVDGAAASSDIDNCCFIDRHCTNDQEWIAGYWAYQNNQCGAPQVSVPATTTSVADTPQSEVNNCCQIGWQCHVDQQWQTGFRAFQMNQCAHQGVEIAGSSNFINLMQNALDMLKSRIPHWYSYVIDGLVKIQEADDGKIRVWPHSGETTFDLGEIGDYDLGYISFVAAALVHEACHVHRGQTGQQTGELVGERSCLTMEIQVLHLLPDSASTISYLQEILDNIEDPAFQWWH